LKRDPWKGNSRGGEAMQEICAARLPITLFAL
jgi:hypothetical protein